MDLCYVELTCMCQQCADRGYVDDDLYVNDLLWLTRRKFNSMTIFSSNISKTL